MALAAGSRNTHAPPSGAAPGRSGARAAGMAAGISGSLIWGSAFLVPVLLGGWNPVIVTLGRYLAYGLLSAVLFALGGRGLRRVLRAEPPPFAMQRPGSGGPFGQRGGVAHLRPARNSKRSAASWAVKSLSAPSGMIDTLDGCKRSTSAAAMRCS